ncbi:Mediator of ErbB2-driven cell motility 1 [Intoshia linei]|uniref:Mediator of ErbB2-driven cell motility 1 n=1 Tax=Intoshia linei TaxID=1819745 RepID=A0A177AWL4_9BILA|nr:Mediator of ErbB2-driven cell motility 1 [Intoshia linei]
MSGNLIRRCTHAGSWYTDNAVNLEQEVKDYMLKAKKDPVSNFEGKENVMAFITPHAGLMYSGPTAGYSYNCIDVYKKRKIFILGPLHEGGSKELYLSKATHWETPIGNLAVDIKSTFYAELESTGKFHRLGLKSDENEHSLELQTPFLATLFKDRIDVTIIPIIISCISASNLEIFGEIFKKYMADESCIFAISSDFCHWGERFGYQFYDNSQGQIFKSIENMDMMGMNIIKTLNPDAFIKYLEDSKNTICGREAITLMMKIISILNIDNSWKIHFLKYQQSSQVTNFDDSSVSYISAVVVNDD